MEQPEAAPDLVGRTSARLLAAGIERRDRLEALHLLAILDASIDTTGRVRRPLDDLAAEFELPPMSVMRSLDHLEHAGAVQRDGAGVVLLGTSADGLGGLQLADFLDDVRASFDDDVPVRRRATLFARGGAALAAAAAALAVITLAPSSGVQTPVAMRDAASSTTIERVLDQAIDEVSGPLDTTIQPSTTFVSPAVTPPVLDTAVAAAAEPPCPTGSPVAEIIDGLVHITNPTGESLIVRSIALGATTVTQTIVVPAGETVTRDLGAPVLTTDVAIVDWEWSNASVTRSCPS
jgi:hypothetical protein